MKSYIINGILLAFFMGMFFPCFSQPVLVVEKIGTRSRFSYSPGDMIKLRPYKPDTLLRGYMLSVLDSSLTLSLISSQRWKHAKPKSEEEAKFLSGIYPMRISYPDIKYIYRQYSFPRKFGTKTGWAAVMYFTIITLDHLLNNQPVFTPDVFIVSGACVGVSLVSLSLMQQRIKIGPRWKLKVMDFHIH